jgi:hypothetical protein
MPEKELLEFLGLLEKDMDNHFLKRMAEICKNKADFFRKTDGIEIEEILNKEEEILNLADIKTKILNS